MRRPVIAMLETNQVAVVDLKTMKEARTRDWKVKRLIDTGKGADGLAWAGQKTRRVRNGTGVQIVSY
jgi:hypothetical protein